MPRLLRLLPVALALLAGCAGPNLTIQDPMQPVLESVRLSGHRLCGSGDAQAARSVVCGELPGREPSAWKLTPAQVPAADPNRLHANRLVAINVSTPPKSELDLELMREGNQLPQPLQLVATDAAAGVPGEIAVTGQAGVSVIDDGAKKLWIVEVVLSTCAESARLRFYARATKNAERSPPLEVMLVRGPGERICIDQAGHSTTARPGIGEPVNLRAATGCAGSGGTGKLFQTCETCPALHPAQMSVFSTGRYCSWEEVLLAYGYAEGSVKSQQCKLSQVGSREACEGR